MSLDSTSTLAQIDAEYADNADYHVTLSVAKAKDFITACRFLIGKLPERAANSGEEVQHSIAAYQQQIEDAERFINSYANVADGGVGVIHADFRNCRD